MAFFRRLFSFLESKPRSAARAQAELAALRNAHVETREAKKALAGIQAEERKLKEIRSKKKAGELFSKLAADEEIRAQKRRAEWERADRKALENAEREVQARVREPLWRFLNEDEWVDSPQSSNVASFRFLHASNELEIMYKDGSAYLYGEISPELATELFNAPSKGSFVWDRLRRRGSVFGFQKPYQLISAFGKQRHWMKTPKKRKRHGKIGPEGEPYKGWRP
jgi:KTSC domain